MKRVFCLFVLISILFPTQIFAKEPGKVKSVLNLFGVTFSYGIPPWVSGNPKTLLKESKTHRNQKGPSFILEYIPAGETFESWKTLFAVKAYYVGRVPPVGQWASANIRVFQRSCAGYQAKIVSRTSRSILVRVLCPQIKGYADKSRGGEVMIGRYMVVRNVLIGHYLEWRGAAFDAADEKSWPVTKQEIKRGIGILKGAAGF